jgi:hypothetical protein
MRSLCCGNAAGGHHHLPALPVAVVPSIPTFDADDHVSRGVLLADDALRDRLPNGMPHLSILADLSHLSDLSDLSHLSHLSFGLLWRGVRGGWDRDDGQCATHLRFHNAQLWSWLCPGGHADAKL